VTTLQPLRSVAGHKPERERGRRSPTARTLTGGGVMAAAAVAVLLAAFSERYGFHRDELYFLAAGHHLAWGYPDQGPLTPALARLMSAVTGNALWGIRLPAELAAAGCVLLADRIAAEFGANHKARLLTCSVIAVSPMLLAMGHLLSTTTFDVTLSVALTLLLVRTVRCQNSRWLVAAGAVTGVGMLNKPLIGTLALVLVVAMLSSRHRHLLLSQWGAVGVVVALGLAAPYLAWQASHGWPQLEMARAISAGSSGTSEPRQLFLPMQILFLGPLLTPLWVVGLVVLLRRPLLAPYRFLATAFAMFAVLLVATGGKPYYLAAVYPPLVAASSQSVVDWCRTQRRRRLLGAAVTSTAILATMIFLPVLPAHDADPIVAVNYDAGETIGWPQVVAQVDGVVRRAGGPHSVDLLTDNYGEAGAIDLYGQRYGIHAAYSGHNGFGNWPPSPAAAGATAVVVGMNARWLQAWYRSVTLAGRLDNRLGIGNDEQGTPLWVCHGLRQPWPAFWSAFRHLG
jgi:Dolichyl-phosphate-mannose-protein mannosyltransferase